MVPSGQDDPACENVGETGRASANDGRLHALQSAGALFDQPIPHGYASRRLRHLHHLRHRLGETAWFLRHFASLA